MRMYVPKFGRDSVNFAVLNRGKRSLALDLKSQQDRAEVRRLLAGTDVLIEQFRPGIMSRLRPRLRRGARDQPRGDLLLDYGLWAERAARQHRGA
jgi:alpha-methylacyl-CoA racemase